MIGSIKALDNLNAKFLVRLKIMILSKSIWFYKPTSTHQMFAAKFLSYATIQN